MWLATEGGLTRYRPGPEPPVVRVREVMADPPYGSVRKLSLVGLQALVRFAFQGSSFTTRPAGMAYVYCLEGHDPGWRVTRQRQVTYRGLEPGEYTFRVKAVDQDLLYSEPVSVALTVTPDDRPQALQRLVSGDGECFVGQSRALARVQQQLEQVASSHLTVLIRGETGTGKGLAARVLHEQSRGSTGPFLPVNCGAIPEGLVESELFGHERGAFTGAHARKLGKVELATGGTLFLDEIGDMSLEAQIRLLHLLEEGTYERLGGTQRLKAEVRVVAATNRDLRALVEEGSFREDLFFRLNVFPVELPPLRERKEDIPLLADFFVAQTAKHLHRPIRGLTAGALARLQAYAWPGNVRELQHAVERAVIVCQGEQVQAEDIALELGQKKRPTNGGYVSLEEQERRYIRQVLEETGWVIKGNNGAATILGLPESTLRGRIRKLGIERL